MLIGVTGFAQAPVWLWAKSAGEAHDDYANSIAVDSSGNTYVTGYFASSTITFGTTTLLNMSTPPDLDIFLTKYDANGNVIWAKSAGSIHDDVAHSISLDASGNIYIAGEFAGPTLTIDTITLTDSSYSDIFIAKFNADGNVLWAKSIGGTHDDWANSIAVDPSGNFYIVGWYDSPTLSFGSTTLTSAGSEEIYLAKFDTNGNPIWAKSATGTAWDCANSVAIDSYGNVFFSGGFESSTLNFGSTTLTNVGGEDIFLAKYDSSGNIIWAKGIGGTSGRNANSVAMDALGNVSLSGTFYSPTISIGATTLTNADNTSNTADLFLAKFNTGGNALWAKRAGGTDSDWSNSITIDPSGNIYMTGGFASPSLTFGSTTLTNTGYYNIFLTKYDAGGNVLWAKKAGDAGFEDANSIAMDMTGNIYIAGNFCSNALAFGTTVLTNPFSANYTFDLFLAKSENSIGISELSDSLNIYIFPNPSSGNATIIIPEKAIIEILNIEGQLIKTINTADKQTGIDVSDLSSGVYIIKAKTDRGVAVKKFIKE